MKYFITGISGQLGYDVYQRLISLGVEEILAPDEFELDITDKDKIQKYLLDNKPDVIFHCAAYTAVDKAEEEKERCYDINVNGTKYICEIAKKINAKIVYISTDYVFEGNGECEYKPEDKVNPVNYYGYTKMLGEEEIKKCDKYYIVRISWVFGINGKNFIRTMLKLSETKDRLSVVSDQIGSPTYTKDLAVLLTDMVNTDKYGIYHATNEGYCSWNEFAKYIFEINNKEVVVDDVLTKDYKTLAKRPLNSRLNKDKLTENGFKRLPSWKDATKRYCNELKEEK